MEFDFLLCRNIFVTSSVPKLKYHFSVEPDVKPDPDLNLTGKGAKDGEFYAEQFHNHVIFNDFATGRSYEPFSDRGSTFDLRKGRKSEQISP